MSIYGDMVGKLLELTGEMCALLADVEDVSTYGDMVRRSMELTERNVYTAGR